MKQDGYQIVNETLHIVERLSLFKMFLRSPKHASRRMIQKAAIWFKGGKLAPIGKLKIRQMNDLISAIQKSKGGKLPPQYKLTASTFGINTKTLNNPKNKKQIMAFLKNMRNSTKAAIRSQQAQSKRLVIGAGVVPPVLSTAAGVGASAAIAKHYSRKGQKN